LIDIRGLESSKEEEGRSLIRIRLGREEVDLRALKKGVVLRDRRLQRIMGRCNSALRSVVRCL